MNRLVHYLRDTRTELRHVSWPTTRQAIIYTGLVIGISILVAAYTGLLDFVFTKGINFLAQ